MKTIQCSECNATRLKQDQSNGNYGNYEIVNENGNGKNITICDDCLNHGGDSGGLVSCDTCDGNGDCFYTGRINSNSWTCQRCINNEDNSLT